MIEYSVRSFVDRFMDEAINVYAVLPCAGKRVGYTILDVLPANWNEVKTSIFVFSFSCSFSQRSSFMVSCLAMFGLYWKVFVSVVDVRHCRHTVYIYISNAINSNRHSFLCDACVLFVCFSHLVHFSDTFYSILFGKYGKKD